MTERNAIPLLLEYPDFVRDISRDLRLSPEEQRLAAEFHPAAWVYWGLAALSGNEIVPTRSNVDPGTWGAPLLSTVNSGQDIVRLNYQESDLTGRVDGMYRSKNPAVRQRFSRFSARLAAWTMKVGDAIGHNSPTWNELIPSIPQTTLESGPDGKPIVTFLLETDFQFPVDGPLDTVMTFGPGLSGAELAARMTGHVKNIHFVSGGRGAEFVNSWIGLNLQEIPTVQTAVQPVMNEGRVQFKQSRTFRAVPEARYFQDGIAASVGMLSTKRSVDLMLMSAVHSAGVEECSAGVQGAAEHLRPGGLLVIKAPDVSRGNEAGLDRLSELADKLLGDPVAQGPCGDLRQNMYPDLPLDRSASFAIYQR